MKKAITTQKNIALLHLFFLNIILFAQTPYNQNLSSPPVLSSGTTVYTGYNITSSQQINGTANVSYIATNEIHLTSGFSATGTFNAKIDGTQMTVADMTTGGNPWNPNKYQRFEIGIALPTSPNLQQQINTFLSTGTPGTGINPYDPNQIKIQVDFTQGGTTNTRYGFYYKGYNESGNDWIVSNPSDPYTFRVRYAPPSTGTWNFTVNLLVNNTSVTDFSGSFNVNNSGDQGFLNVTDGSYPGFNQYLRFYFPETNNFFFGMGEDIASAWWDYSVTGGFSTYATASPNTYNAQRSYINDLASKGGNFIRMRVNEPWSNCVETIDKHIFPNDPATPLPLANCLTNYDHNQKHMWEMDQTLALCESKSVYIMLCLLNDQYYITTNPYGNQAWADNPYSTLLGNNATGIDLFFTNGNAAATYQKTFFYIMARWGYSPHIALWEHINETDQMGSNITGDANNWVCGMKGYIQGMYPHHPSTTGFAGPNTSTCLNVWSEHNYGSTFNINYGNYGGVTASGRNKTAMGYWNGYRPFLFGEVGGENYPYNCRFIDTEGDREYHNSIWAGTFSGALTTPLNWNDWQEINGVNHRQNFVGLSTFLNGNVNFKQPLYPKLSKISSPSTGNSYLNFYNFYLANAGTNITNAYGWAQNSTHYWRSDNSYSSYPGGYNCDNNSNSGSCYSVSGTNTIKFEHMENWSHYQINLYSPYSGTYVGNIQKRIGFSHTLNFQHGFGCGQDGDVAYVLNRIGGYARMADTTINSSVIDSIQVNQNPYCVDAAGGIDSYQNYNYYWNLGNGTTSTDSNLCINYAVGNYTISLCYIDGSGDTVNCLSQQLVVLDTTNTTTTRIKQPGITDTTKAATATENTTTGINTVMVKNNIKVYPNPTQNQLYIINQGDMPIDNYILLDVLGTKQNITFSKNYINTGGLISGTYFLHIISNGYETVFKIIKTD